MNTKKHRQRDGRAPLDADDMSLEEASPDAQTPDSQTPAPTEEPDSEHRQGHRHARLQSILRAELGTLLRDDVSDPTLHGVTVTSVELSIDYRNARVYVRLSPGQDPRKTALALEKVSPFLRANLSDALDMKFVPSLRFVPALTAEDE